MPSYVIHLAVAEEYLRKNKKEKVEYEQFIKGVIYPDSTTDKSQTHYGRCSSESNLFKFLQENELESSFNRGYFLHLLTDYLFYNKCIEYWSRDIYNDYDILNERLKNEYRVVLPKETMNCVHFERKSELKILSLPIVEEFIDKVSCLDIDNIAKEVEELPEKWTKIRPLKRL